MRAWRHTATNLFMVVSAVVYLPAVVLFWGGQGPPVAWPVKAALAVACLTVAAGVLLRRSDFRPRMWALLISAYILAFLGCLAIPQGVFIRAMAFVLPMLAMVLLGALPGRVATMFGAGIFLLLPFLYRADNLPEAVASAATVPSVPPGLTWTQVAAQMAMLIAAMTLLDRFHYFLAQSLARLQRETAERSATN